MDKRQKQLKVEFNRNYPGVGKDLDSLLVDVEEATTEGEIDWVKQQFLINYPCVEGDPLLDEIIGVL